MLSRFTCPHCGAVHHDEGSWARHCNTCFSRVTTCSLCGQTMPTQHRDEHLRVIHGVNTNRINGLPAMSASSHKNIVLQTTQRSVSPSRTAAPAAANVGDNDNHQQRWQQQQEEEEDLQAQEQRQQKQHRALLQQKRSPVMASALSIVPLSNPNMRTAAKSPALCRIAASNGLEVLTSSSPGKLVNKGRDGGMLAAVLSNQQQQQQQQGDNSSSSSAPPPAAAAAASSAASGFSFKSNDDLLRRAGTPERMRQLKQEQLAEKVQMKSFASASTPSSSSTTAPDLEEQRAAAAARASAKGRLQVVEDVVHNIVSHSPNRRVGGEYTDQRKPHHLLPRSMQREIEAEQDSRAPPSTSRVVLPRHQRTPSLSLLQMAAAASGAPTPTAVTAAAAATAASYTPFNEGMMSCPDCSKAIFSMEQHRCPAQFTDCPKCGERVRLLAFDRHFIECAIPSWSATRERKEKERLMQRNSAAFRATRSTVDFLGSSKSQGSFLAPSRSMAAGVAFEKSFKFSDDVAKLLDHDGDDTEKEEGNDSLNGSDNDGGDPQGMLAFEKRERQEQRRAEAACRQAELEAAAQCPPGHRLCVLCRKPVPEQQMPDHLDSCNSNLLSCPLCFEGVPAHELESHQLQCPANRRRCFSCGTSVQFSRLAEHVETCCTTGVQKTMYHGTSDKAAREIIKNGFLPSANGLLGEGVYMSQNVAKAKNYGPVILEAVVSISSGKVLTVPALGHRLQKSWQRAGYDAAWMPPGVSKSGLEEHCIKDPRCIVVKKLVKDA